jgi:hypothetical protein
MGNRMKRRDLLSFGIIFSTNPPDPSKLPEPDFTSKVIKHSRFPWRHKCGHKGHIHYSLSIKGEMTKKLWFDPQCPDCKIPELEKDVISCALCGLAITPGEGVALYNSKLPDVNAEFAYVITTDADGDWVAGCMRMNCCPSGGYFAGNWMGHEEGFVPFDFKAHSFPIDDPKDT